MGLRGPQPKPRALRVLEGITKPHKLNSGEPEPKLASPEPPVPLSPEQRLVWDALAPELIRIGTLTMVDTPAFLRYIDLTLEYNEMQRQIAGRNYFFILRDDKGNPKYISLLPQVTVRDRAQAAMLKLESHFGMTPSSRTRVYAILNSGGKNHSGGTEDDFFDLDDD